MKPTLVLGFALVGFFATDLSWKVFDPGIKANFRGVSAVNPLIAWASGSRGSVLKTIDGGVGWKKVVVPDSADLDFRDVEAFDNSTAYLLSIGAGDLSRIFKTSDGGTTWTTQHVNRDPRGFLDALAFWDVDHGLALGDPIDGRFSILMTEDAGRTWSKPPADGMPESLPGEVAFAASGTCLAVEGTRNAWFGTGGGATARIFRSTDRGRTWAVSTTPLRAGTPSSGVFSIVFRDARHGLAVGGDYRLPDQSPGNLAITEDGGATWSAIGDRRPNGFRSAVAFVPGLDGREVLAMGPNGSDYSTDRGQTWKPLGPPGFHAMSFGGATAWGVGSEGRIGKLDWISPK